MTTTQINAELLAKLRAAVGGVGYLARYAGMNVAAWEQWETEAREVIRKAEVEQATPVESVMRPSIQGDIVNAYIHNEYGPAAVVECPRCCAEVSTVSPNGSKCSCGIEWTFNGTGFLPESMQPPDFRKVGTVRIEDLK